MKRKLINRKSMGTELHYLNHHYLRRTLVRPVILFSKA